MKAMVDLNILVDVLQKRMPFLKASAEVCELVHLRTIAGVLPAHAVTTVFYLVEKLAGKTCAEKALDWMMSLFEVVPEDKSVFCQAKSLGFDDFEDAVVAAAALNSGCDCIVTRNIADFAASPVKAITPEELITMIQVDGQ